MCEADTLGRRWGEGSAVTGGTEEVLYRVPLIPSFFSSFLLHLGSSHPGVLGTSPCTTLPDPISQALPPHLPSCPAPQEAGERCRSECMRLRGQSWEGPGQRPLPWGDRGEIEPQTLWVHISAWEIQDDKSTEETGNWHRVGKGLEEQCPQGGKA